MASDAYAENRAAEVYGGMIPLTIIATVAVVLRMIARRVAGTTYWWDDLTVVVALVLYFCCAAAIKSSLILLYYRLFGVISWFRNVLFAAWIIVLLYWIINSFVAIFECRPVAYFWDITIPGGTCINEEAFFRWNGVANLLIDFMILLLPAPIVWQLKASIRQKALLTGLFSLGLLYVPHLLYSVRRVYRLVYCGQNFRACVASIVRVTYFDQINFLDLTYTTVLTLTWTTVEQSLGITCACLSTIRPLLNRILPSSISNPSNPPPIANPFEPAVIPLSRLSLKTAEKHKPLQGNINISTSSRLIEEEEELPLPMAAGAMSKHVPKVDKQYLPQAPWTTRNGSWKEQDIEHSYCSAR
ncbi:MAG: hypothetical protein LQ351_000258 [Letrouitia transgressa]|nr:MAG: hypothetical protein LQ351_000258 [Letrouitia transgressa]